MSKDAVIFTVTELNKQVRVWLENDLGDIHVTGELSNVTRPSSGHLYFTLKDTCAQIKCVFFRNHHTKDTAHLEHGQHVTLFGKLSLYEARGDYQLIVKSLQLAGSGALYQQFEQLKQTLSQQGLFDTKHKRMLKRFPTHIAIVTSSTSAALKDMLITLKNRFPVAKLFIYHADVQGKAAAPSLIQALKYANLNAHAEVIILARGGGSIEDLWAFNDEALAHAIYQSRLPVVSGIGHETDFTIADFVADIRAATPTAAAQTVTPNKTDLINEFTLQQKRLSALIYKKITEQRIYCHNIAQRLKRALPLASYYWQKIDHMERQFTYHMQARLRYLDHRLALLHSSLVAYNPNARLKQGREKLQKLVQNLKRAMDLALKHHFERFQNSLHLLNLVSPLSTLERGYAVALKQQHVLISTKDIAIGDEIEVRLAKGCLTCRVLTAN